MQGSLSTLGQDAIGASELENGLSTVQVVGLRKKRPSVVNWIESRFADRRGEEPQSHGNSRRVGNTELRLQFCAPLQDCFLDRVDYILIGSTEIGLIGYHINISRG